MSVDRKRIVDLIQKDKATFSFEVTPDLDVVELDHLCVETIFFSVTWHAKSHGCVDLDVPPLKLATALRRKGKNVLLHLSCDFLRSEYLDKVLGFLQENDIMNLFIVVGEKYDSSTSDFKSSKELISHIRATTGNYFCIGIAGFPDNLERIPYLKEKVDVGADFIITQAFFEPEIYENFCKECLNNGITVPVIPGMFLFDNLQQLLGFSNLCKVKVSENFTTLLNEGTEAHDAMLSMMKDIVNYNPTVNFHFFTLNKLHTVSQFLQKFKALFPSRVEVFV